MASRCAWAWLAVIILSGMPMASLGAEVIDFAIAFNTVYVLDDTGTLWRAYYPPCSAWNFYDVGPAVAIAAGFIEDAVVAYDDGSLLPIYYGDPQTMIPGPGGVSGVVEVGITGDTVVTRYLIATTDNEYWVYDIPTQTWEGPCAGPDVTATLSPGTWGRIKTDWR